MTTAIAYDPTTDGRVRELPALDTAEGGAAPEIDDPRNPRLGVQLERLARLADMGMELAEGLTRKAARIETEGEEIAPGYEAVCLAFTRIARAIRQIHAQEHEILGLSEEVRRETRQARAEAEELAAEERKIAGRRRVLGTVRDLLEAQDDIDDEERDDLLGDLHRDYDDYYDLYQGSFDEIVRRVCRDLGIAETRPARARSKPARAKRARSSANDDDSSVDNPRGRDPP